VGLYGSLVWQLIIHLLGQCEPIIWNRIGPPEGFAHDRLQAIVGQFECIDKRENIHSMGQFDMFSQQPFRWLETMWANTAFFCSSSCACWANSSQSYRMTLAHPRALHTIDYRLLWAYLSASAGGRKYIAWANARGFLSNHSAGLK